MQEGIKNLVFEGGGVLGTAYLGMLKFLDENAILADIKRVAGTSAGAITACITSFNLPFDDMRRIADSLDYKKVPATKDKTNVAGIEEFLKQIEVPNQMASGDDQEERAFKNPMNNIDCIYRLVTKYGWYSSAYFYEWIKLQIASQFDVSKKAPPYTFEDFRNPEIHKGKRPFKELYIVGTDISNHIESVFSYETTPQFEVAQAVRISMSIPLYFESVKFDEEAKELSENNLFVDGGLLWNYPIGLFDREGKIARTLGGILISGREPDPIKNLVDFIGSVISAATGVQKRVYRSKPEDMARSIPIYTGKVSALNFDIKPGDEQYQYLFTQGYIAAACYFNCEK
ncbi:MAG: patatin-like phospholipase family protein [Cellulosilyticaceae bacterium]